MNKLQSIVRSSVMGIALVGGLGTMQQVLAAGIGPCSPVGAVHNYDVIFNKNITVPGDNEKGKVIGDDNINHNWKAGVDGAAAYLVNCQCTDDKMSASYISVHPAPGIGAIRFTKEGVNYYAIPGTQDTLALGAQVYVGGDTDTYFSVPFTGKSNGWEGDTSSCSNKKYASGGAGKISLYFLRPFVGEMSFSGRMLDVHISASPTAVKGLPVVATVSINGRVSVAQSCEIHNAAIPINFGDIMSESFKVAGEMPVGFDNVYEGRLTMACGNISNGVQVYLTLKGEPNIHNKTALRTTKEDGSENEDIGIRFINNNVPSGKSILIPSPLVEDAPSKDSLLPVTMSGLGNLDSTGETSFLAYPISTTGKPPVVGTFNATATLNVHLESKD